MTPSARAQARGKVCFDRPLANMCFPRLLQRGRQVLLMGRAGRGDCRMQLLVLCVDDTSLGRRRKRTVSKVVRARRLSTSMAWSLVGCWNVNT
jgi:hypothetical protein